MTQFVVHSANTVPEGSKAALKATEKAWGFIPQLHGILAESPAALIGYDTLFGLVSQCTLSPIEQQVAYLVISVFHECEYCTMGHTFLSRQGGLDEASLEALRAEKSLTTPRLESLRSFTLAIVRERGFVGDAAVNAFLDAGFTQANVLELVTIIATKTVSNYVSHLAHTPHEGFMSDPALLWVSPRNRGRAA